MCCAFCSSVLWPFRVLQLEMTFSLFRVLSSALEISAANQNV